MLANDRLAAPFHVLAILAVGLATVLPSYYIADMASFRPTRALGPLVWSNSETTSAPILQEPIAQEPIALQPSVATEKPAVQTANEPPQGDSPKKIDADKAAAAAATTVPATKNTSNSHLYGEEHLSGFFRALKERKQGPVRVLHYGDSTLAGDGIAKTVRTRMQTSFGNGGPGFFVAGMDPRWMRRDDVRVDRTGEWNVQTILFGGNKGRYGLGGVVAKPHAKSQILISPPKPKAVMGEHLELYAQKSRRDEVPAFEVNGIKIDSIKRVEHQAFDQWIIDSAEPISRVKITVAEPNLEVYGAVIEAARGITWETTAVVGIASGSIRQFDPAHLAEQTAARNPDLIVIMLGGNETNHGGLMTPEGRVYKEGFTAALKVLRQGAPKAACLVMSPLDQGVLNDDGRITSRPLIERMVTYQRQVSLDNGCAFWNTWQFMGGRDSFARWLSQGLAWTDLNHLTEKGLHRIGNAFSDALLQSYQRFEAGQ
jgi:lysophospholipase L1-like esterase